MSRARLVAPGAVILAVLLATLAGSCTDVSTGPNEAVALAFDSLPYPSIVAGDTLRDSLGKVAPLRAVAYSASGAVIQSPGIQYLALDSVLSVSSAGVATARSRSGTGRFVAIVNGIQSVTKSLLVSRRPDSVVATSSRDTTVLFTIPDSAARNVTGALALKITTTDTAGGILATAGWLVSYQTFFRGAALASADTTRVSLWDESGRVSMVDTTGADGSASRRLRLRSLQLPTTPDSFVVIATVRYRGAAVRGSPLRFVIRTRPR